MTEEEQLRLMIKGLISELSTEQRSAFDRCDEQVRAALKSAPLEIATLVIGFIGAELQVAKL